MKQKQTVDEIINKRYCMKKRKKTIDELTADGLSENGITFLGSGTRIPEGELRLFVIEGKPYSVYYEERKEGEAALGLHIELKAYTSLAELVSEMNLRGSKQADYIVSSIQEFPIRKGDIYSTEYRDSWSG